MSTLDVILIIVVAVLLVLFLGGQAAARRRAVARDARLLARLHEANQALAQAHASDNGWDRATMESAARQAHGGAIDALHLVQVIDRPGTEEDEAVFEAVSGDRVERVHLRRSGDAWAPAASV